VNTQVSLLSATLDHGRSETCPAPCATEGFVASCLHPDYQLDAQLGAGGMAQVYRATHIPTRQAVAIKVFRRGRIARDVEEQQRRVECEMLRTLRHRNIVRLFDDHAGNGNAYLVMELVEGDTTTQLVREDGPLPLEIACEVIRQAAVALGHMHDRGLVHRDIKPSNVMLSKDGVVKVIDLGLTLRGRPALHKASPFQAGTLNYMAPEQFRASDQIDGRADVFSLGCTLYYLLTGRHYLQCTRSATGKRQVKRSLPLEQAAPAVPAWVVRLFNKMVAEDPADRLSSMGAVAAQLPVLHEEEEDLSTASRSTGELESAPLPFVKPLRVRSSKTAA
jgi:serine/threonine protein kinase